MADLTEELRQWKKEQDRQIAEQGTYFERIAKRFYVVELNRSIVSWGKVRHKELFGIPDTEPQADFVIDDGIQLDGRRRVIIAEAKGQGGTDIDHALKQLENLGRWVLMQQKQPTSVTFHLLLRDGLNPDQLVPTREGARFRAAKMSEQLGRRSLYRLDRGGDTNLLKLSTRNKGRPVFVLFL